jgi:hypothetical protein
MFLSGQMARSAPARVKRSSDRWGTNLAHTGRDAGKVKAGVSDGVFMPMIWTRYVAGKLQKTAVWRATF